MSKVFLPSEIIKKKRNREALSQEEIEFFISSYATGILPDYQMSALMMAIYFSGMSSFERHILTQSMLRSGSVLDFSDIDGFKVDKHSTGGVGDKTSLILAPIVAACGLYVPMIAGRGLGHTGGTLDKLESIPGFNVQLELAEFKRIVKKLGFCIIGQTKEICPADKKMYALRDVTATVESLPLICGSIMSKKIAEGIDGLVLDVKVGTAAFIKTMEQELELCQALIETGRDAGKKVSAFVTQMDEPLGTHIGNSLEVEECLAILRNDPSAQKEFRETRHLSLVLAAEMLRLAGVCIDIEEGQKKCEQVLSSGKAFELFEKLCAEQGGNLRALPKAKQKSVVVAPQAGFVTKYQTEQVGLASVVLGAGRLTFSDVIDPTAGMICHKRIGDVVEKGEPIFTLFAANNDKFVSAQEALLKATTISLQKPPTPSLILKHMVI